MRHIQTGVQHGKGPIDEHFATNMKQSSRYCNVGHGVETLINFFNTFGVNGRVNNIVPEIFFIIRLTINAF